jgi:hypothetical protein
MLRSFFRITPIVFEPLRNKVMQLLRRKVVAISVRFGQAEPTQHKPYRGHLVDDVDYFFVLGRNRPLRNLVVWQETALQDDLNQSLRRAVFKPRLAIALYQTKPCQADTCTTRLFYKFIMVFFVPKPLEPIKNGTQDVLVETDVKFSEL